MKRIKIISIILIIQLISLYLPINATAKINWNVGIKLMEFESGYLEDPPNIELDSDSNFHILFNNINFDEPVYRTTAAYFKISSSGEILIENLHPVFTQSVGGPIMDIDANDNIHICWSSSTPVNDWAIYYKKMDKYGNVLINDVRVSNITISASNPDLKVDTQNNVHIVWDGNISEMYYSDFFYTKLNSYGEKILNDTMLTNLSLYRAGFAHHAKIELDSQDNVHMVWYDSRDALDYDIPVFEIYYTKLNNNGTKVVNDKRLTDFLADSSWPEIVIDSNDDIHIVWMVTENEYSNEDLGIFYAKLDNNGSEIVGAKKLIAARDLSGWPSIFIDNNDIIHITWYTDGKICYGEIDKNGNLILSDRNILRGSSYTDLVFVDPNSIGVVWENPFSETIYFGIGTVVADSEETNLWDFNLAYIILLLIFVIIISPLCYIRFRRKSSTKSEKDQE
jgi:hypothetical protein